MKTQPANDKRTLTYATVCSGIECCSVACRGLPLHPVFFSEIEPFPCAVLKAHYPDVPNLGDMSKIQVTNQTEITNGITNITLSRPLDILAGGTPCQDVSVVGKRAGMQKGSGTRSSLAFEFVRIARELEPRYILWENVAGCIDSKNAPNFLAFLRALGDCGYSLAWRVLDAQYVRVDGMERAVPQRRRRVWVVGCLGADESRAAQILFEPDCVAGHTPPRRCAGQGFAYSLARCDRVDAPVVGEPSGNRSGGLQSAIALDGDKLTGALPAKPGMKQQTYVVSGDCVSPFGSAVCFEPGIARREGALNRFMPNVASTLRSNMGDNLPAIAMRYIVRRLTPKEAERLMGLPDSYTIPMGLRRFFDANGEPSPELVSEFVDIFDKFNAIMAEYKHKKPPKGKSYNQVAAWLKRISDPATCPNSPRYKGDGNGMATNQPRWILARLLAIGEGIDPFDN